MTNLGRKRVKIIVKSYLIPVVAAASIVGCSARSYDLPEGFLKPPQGFTLAKRDDSAVSVAITYPAAFSPKARVFIKNLYDKADVFVPGRTGEKVDNKAFDDTLLKTSYYVHEFR